MGSERNKTLVLTDEETQRLLGRCVFSPKRGDGLIDEVICADAFEALGAIKRRSVDLLVVDPPYNLTKAFAGDTFRKRSDAEYKAFTEAWIRAVKPLLKKTASVYVCCDAMSGIIIAPLLTKHFRVRQRITWQREKGRGALSNWKNAMEDIWFCTVGDEYTFNLDAVRLRRVVKAPYRDEKGEPKDWFEDNGVKYRDTCPSNFWDDITVPYWSMPENTSHPTQKPEKLLAKLILASSNEGDLVLDPFGGSGSTAVAAKKLNRRFITVEKSKDYCALAVARLDRAVTDRRIQGYEDGVFWARGEKK